MKDYFTRVLRFGVNIFYILMLIIGAVWFLIVLTTYKGDALAWRALKAGAVGYLLKSSLRADLLQAIRAVHAGGRSILDAVE